MLPSNQFDRRFIPRWLIGSSFTLGRVRMIFPVSRQVVRAHPRYFRLPIHPVREVEESERSRPVDDISSIFTTHEMIYHEIHTIVF